MFSEENGIKLPFITMYHPQANGQVEVTNHMITAIMTRKVRNNLGMWVDMILEAMWAY